MAVSQIARMLLLVLLGLIMPVASQTSTEWTTVINKAGRQRMLSQKMTKEFLLVAKGISASTNKDSMLATANEFETALGDLINGSSSGGIMSPPTAGITNQLNIVKGLWDSYGALLRSNVDANPIPTSVLSSVPSDSENLLVQMNAAVGLYATAAGSNAPGAVVNVAGRQRMLSQKMSRDALLVGLSIDTSNSITSLTNARNLFNNSHQALVNGGTVGTATLPPTNSSCILAQMGVVAGIWATFEAQVSGIISSGSASDDALNQIATLNPTLLTEANNAVTMYVQEAAGTLNCAGGGTGVGTAGGALNPVPSALAVAAAVAAAVAVSWLA